VLAFEGNLEIRRDEPFSRTFQKVVLANPDRKVKKPSILLCMLEGHGRRTRQCG